MRRHAQSATSFNARLRKRRRERVARARDNARCKLLNSGVYATPLVSAPLRAGRTMAAGAKLCSAHQEILCATKETVLTPALARAHNIRPNLEE